jgi:capsular exopolysaccharide synthesis family protein
MNELDKYHDQVIETSVADSGASSESGSIPVLGLITGVLRRWYVVLAIFAAVCFVGIPAIWFLKEPAYNVTGFIRVAPILTNLLSGEVEKGEISNYQSFMNTEAIRVTSSSIVERVADNLVDKKLRFFEEGAADPVKKLNRIIAGDKAAPNLVSVLKEAVADEILTAKADKLSELIRINMECKYPEEAKQIVDAFIRAYMATAVSDSSNAENQKLSLLENEQKVLLQKLESQRETILKLGQEFGATSLDDRYNIKLQRVSGLLGELTKLESERMRLEIEVNMLEQSKSEERADPAELVRIRQEYVNTDSRVKTLAENITQLEQQLIVARQMLAPQNPELAVKAGLIEKLKERLAELKKEAEETFDSSVSKVTTKTGGEKLLQAKAALERTMAYEKSYREKLAKEDIETVEVGRKQLSIKDLQDQLALTKERYDQYTRRIQELELERKQPARISVAQYADIASISDKRIKLTLAIVFGAMACGVAAAFLMAKADHRMWTPSDVTKSINIRIIGTTTSLDDVERALLPERTEEDFQTICANLGLFSETGRDVPKRLVITSPGAGDGKTTSAINLATSLSRRGKKVLLIDGDLRKPDVAHFLSLPKDLKGLQDVISEGALDQAVCRLPSIGFDIIPAAFHNAPQAYELLMRLHEGRHIDKICEKYDHVIIDTPPVLAFPDALIWAKMVGSVLLTSVAGQTTGVDLQKARERLAQTNIALLGIILCNVQADRGYYGYAYKYYMQNGKNKKNRKSADKKRFLMSTRESDNAIPESNPDKESIS